MKKGWEYKKLGKVCDQLNGLWKGKKEPFINVGVIRNANFTKDFTLNTSNIEYLDVEERSYSKRKLYPGDLIVEKSGGSEKQPVGRAILFDIAEGEYSFSNFTSVLRIKDRSFITPEYLYKFLLHSYKRGDTRAMQNAATGIHNIIWESYLGIEIPVPPLAEQEEIVRYLDAAFAKIDALKKIAEQQLTESKALFQKALSEYLSPKKGWEEKKLKEIGRTQTGTTPSKNNQEYYGSEIPFIRPSEIDIDGVGGLCYDAELKLSNLGADKGRVFDSGSIFMVCIGATISKTGISNKVVSCNQQINVLTPYEGICRRFIYFSLISPTFKGLVIKEGNSAQATLPIINKGKWENLSIPLPPLPEQQAIVAKLDTISAHCRQLEENYRQTLALCDDLKQKILKQVFE